MIIEAFKKKAILFLLACSIVLPCLLFAVGYINEIYLAAMLIMVIYFTFLVLNFEAGFLSLIFLRTSLDYFQTAGGGEGGLNVSAAASLVLIVLSVFYILYRGVNIFNYREVLPFSIFLLICGLSIFASQDFLESVSDWLRFVSIFFIYIVTRLIAVSEKKIRLVLNVILLSVLIPVFLGYYQFLTGSGYETQSEAGRIIGTFAHPNDFSSYLLVVLVFCTAQLCEKESLISKRLLAPLVLLMLFAFVLTFSRGSWVVFVFSMVVMGILRYRRILVFLPVFLIAALFLIPGVQDRIYEVLDPSHARATSGWEWRLNAWAQVGTLLSEKPIFGHGLSMVFIKMGYLTHNDYLRLLVEVGIVGLLAYLWMAVQFLSQTWRDYKRTQSNIAKSFHVGLLALTLGFLLRQAADNTLRNTAAMMFFWIFLALTRNIFLIDSELDTANTMKAPS